MAASAEGGVSSSLRSDAHAFLHRWTVPARTQPADDGFPESPAQLPAWLDAHVERTGGLYQDYLARRKSGAGREYFRTRSHALSFLRQVAPTKLVDGAWLYGLLRHWDDPALGDLVWTYVEELGDGEPDKNHVLLYRRLLQSHGIDDWADQPDACYVQGALQLSLAACAPDMLPEILGFNLGYEQLPLHLLVTAYELDELGIDPCYFSLHVTVDNAASGHARRAIRAVMDHMAAVSAADADAVWARVGDGFRLADAGFGSTDAVRSADVHHELLRILQSKTAEGKLAHSDYCRIEGRTVNQWLASSDGVSGFVDALARKGWLVRGSDPLQSRFWQLLRGQRAEMFGVFGDYELQVVHDWIRGDAADDGASFRSTEVDGQPHAPRPFRHQRRLLGAVPHTGRGAMADDASRATHAEVDADEMLQLMGPAHHWRASGLAATRRFSSLLLRAGSDAVAA